MEGGIEGIGWRNKLRGDRGDWMKDAPHMDDPLSVGAEFAQKIVADDYVRRPISKFWIPQHETARHRVAARLGVTEIFATGTTAFNF